MWNVKTKVIPVITGVNGTISKSLAHYLSNILGKHKIKELQKTAILDTAHIPWKVLMWKYKMFVIRNVFTCGINCNSRMAASACTVETWCVLGR